MIINLSNISCQSIFSPRQNKVRAFGSHAGELKDRLSISSIEAFESFNKKWGYIGKSVIATRHSLNALVRSCRWAALGLTKVDCQIKTLIIRLKLFSIVGVPFSLKMLPAQLEKIRKSMAWNDREGVALGSLSLAMNVTDITDSMTTFTGAFLQTISQPTVGWMSTLGTPLTAALILMGTTSRVIKLVHLTKFRRELHVKMKNSFNSPEQLQELASFVEKKSGISLDPQILDTQTLNREVKTQINTLHTMVLERHTNSKTVELLSALATQLQNGNPLDKDAAAKILAILKEIDQVTAKEMKVQSAFLGTNLMNGCAMLLFYLPVIAPIPFALLATSFVLRIVIQAYQDKK